MRTAHTLLSVLLCATALFAQAAPTGESAAEWNVLHVEQRWARYARATEGAQTETRLAWYAFLANARDFELLEMVAIYDYDPRRGVESPSALGRLVAASAPQWPRVAAWFVGHAGDPAKERFDRLTAATPDSHVKDEALSTILAHAGVFLGWFDAHPGDQTRALQWLADRLRHRAEALPEGGHCLPPLDPAVVLLQWLDAPADVTELEPDAAVDERRRYVQQTVRAIRGTQAAGLAGPLWMRKLLHLTAHPHTAIRREAFLAFTVLRGRHLPWRELVAIAEDAQRPEGDRRLATLAASHGSHPAVFAFLLETAARSEHPATRVAVQRLGDLGHGFAAELLRAEADRSTELERATLCREAAARAAARFADLDAERQAAEVRTMLLRSAWLATSESRFDDAHRDWLVEALAGLAPDSPAGRALRAAAQGVGVDAEMLDAPAHAAVLATVRRIARLALER